MSGEVFHSCCIVCSRRQEALQGPQSTSIRCKNCRAQQHCLRFSSNGKPFPCYLVLIFGSFNVFDQIERALKSVNILMYCLELRIYFFKLHDCKEGKHHNVENINIDRRLYKTCTCVYLHTIIELKYFISYKYSTSYI